MTDSRPNERPRRPRIPNASLDPAETVHGAGMLEELPGEHSQLLWESFRSVGLWALTPRRERSRELFPPGAPERRNRQLAAEWLDPELRAPLEVFRDMMAEPRQTDPALVARACRQVSAWAAERGAVATRFYFAAAAGLCLPDDAEQAYRAGCLARDIAKWDAAEVWLEYAIAVARKSRERDKQGAALLGLGNMYYRQGRYQDAKDAYGAALVLAERHRLPEIEGGALHDLFIVFVETEEYAKAEKFARAALKAYGKEHPSVPGLAHDVAYFWLNRGQGARALRVLLALLPKLKVKIHKTLALANSAWAAGISGNHEVFQQAWNELWSMTDDPEIQPRLAAMLAELAYGAVSLGEREHAEQAARAALEMAEQRGETDVAGRVEALLDSIRRQEPIKECIPTEMRSRAADQFAEELVEALRTGVDAA